MSDQQAPYEAPSVEQIDTDGEPISHLTGSQSQAKGVPRAHRRWDDRHC